MTKTALLKKIGERIIAIRQKQELSQSDLARLSGKDRQNIRRLEKGLINPTVFHLSEIAKALKVKISEIIDVE
jgi:transcriptional regulator with XRE-family HTH domain